MFSFPLDIRNVISSVMIQSCKRMFLAPVELCPLPKYVMECISGSKDQVLTKIESVRFVTEVKIG